MDMTSLWLDDFRQPASQAFVPGVTYDDVVVGAGLTGLTTAVMLARAGRRVGVLEARAIGAAGTGNTTGKISVLQGTRLSTIAEHYPLEITQAYVAAQRAGQDWLRTFCQEKGIAVEDRAAITYAGGALGRAAVEAEMTVGERLGLPVHFLEGDQIGLPFPVHGGVRLAGQAMFNPMDALSALTAELQERGGLLHVGHRVRGVSSGRPCRVTTSTGPIFADHVVLATGAPFLDRGGYFAKQTAQRSYVVAFRVPGEVPADMYLSADQPTRSLRTAADDELLLVGGNGHVVGRHPSPRACVDGLEQWAQRWFPGAEPARAWSAQDYVPHNEIPFVGSLPRGEGKVLVATGYSKWGMANAIAAGLRLSATILGGSTPSWAVPLERRITRPSHVVTGLRAGIEVAAGAAHGWATAEASALSQSPPGEGAGQVGRLRGKPVARSTVDGRTCALSAICTHQGGIVTWNDAEASWDCPLHGSRFDATGQVIEGPATRPLTRVLLPDEEARPRRDRDSTD